MHATIAERLKALDLLSDFECAGSNPASDQEIQISFTFVDAFFILMKLLCTQSRRGERVRFCHCMRLYCVLFHSKLAQSLAAFLRRFYIECYIIFKGNFARNP